MLDGFLRRQATLAQQLVDERVVVGQPQQIAVAQAVRATVADVCDRDVLLADVDGGERGPHPGMLGVGVGELVDPRVGRARQRGERLLGLDGFGEAGLEGLHGDPGRDLAGLRSAHAVGDDEQRRSREQRVLVGATLSSGVGAGVLLGDAQHCQPTSKTNSLSPMRTRSPGCSGRAVSSSSSFRYVPFVDPRSSSTTVLPRS